MTSSAKGRWLKIACTIAWLSAPIESSAQAAPNGWGPWRFGQTLDQALAAYSKVTWNSYSLQECRDRIELEGCLLSTYESPPLPAVDAIPLRPTLKFDKHNTLYEIGLIYEREDRITQDQCLDIFGRLIDWQAGKLGSFKSDDRPIAQSDIKAGWTHTILQSPKGTQFRYGRSKDRTAYVTSFVKWGSIKDANTANVEVSIFSDFVTVGGKPNCHVVVSYEMAE